MLDNGRLAGVCMARDIIPGDRRLQRRYPIELDLEYKIIEHGQVIASGDGRTGNMSSGGLLFHPEQPATRGHLVELSIRWPAILGNSPFVALLISGRIMRNDASGIAVRARRHEFQKLANVRTAFHQLFGKCLVQ
jgi:PilZ domain